MTSVSEEKETARRPLFFLVEGSIGAGKSTLLQQLSRILNASGKKVVVVPEPVDLWESTGALAEFYRDPTGKAYEFQTFVYATRVNRLNAYTQTHSDADIFFIERSVISDRFLFAQLLQEQGCFTPVQWAMYTHWVTLWNQLLPFRAPHGVIYLAPSIDETLRRIAARGRQGESVSREYQEQLHRKHEALLGRQLAPEKPHTELDVAWSTLGGEHSVPILRLFRDDDYRDDDDHGVLKKITQFVSSVSSINIY